MIVDNNVSGILITIIQMGSDLISRLIAVTLFAPVFVLPGLLLGVVGGYLGNVYMKAQLSVKREMSNAKAPVLGHFGAAVAGLGRSHSYRMLASIMTFISFYPGVWSSGVLQKRIFITH